MISVLYVCNEDRATTKQRLMALGDLNVDVDVVYTSRLNEKVPIFKKVFRAVKFRLGIFPERNNENQQVLASLYKKKYDILFVEKGLSIKRSTLVKAKALHPGIKIISYSLDDVMNRQNCSQQYRKALTAYDYHFTNKRYNVEELRHLGAHNVYYFKNAFSTHVHHPVAVGGTEQNYYGADVSFIGTYAKDRVELIRYLADNGIKIKIWGWGPSAKKSGMLHPLITMTGKYVYDEEYAKVVCASKINLCLLRKINRDRETTRSVEIPACGGFMISERTEEQKEMFEEGVEAEYFSNKIELLDKIRYYLGNEDKRIHIAANAVKRCIESDYSYQHQLKEIIKTVLGNEATGNNNNAPNSI
jgi:spore maturation protein CgeB